MILMHVSMVAKVKVKMFVFRLNETSFGGDITNSGKEMKRYNFERCEFNKEKLTTSTKLILAKENEKSEKN